MAEKIRKETIKRGINKMVTEQNIIAFSEQCKNIFTQIERDVIGQKDIVEETIIAMIAGGNVLLEGVPGVGKTRLVRTLGRVFNLPFSRIQFTPPTKLGKNKDLFSVTSFWRTKSTVQRRRRSPRFWRRCRSTRSRLWVYRES